MANAFSGDRSSLSFSSKRSILLESVEAFFFNCDGVTWKGKKLIEGVLQALQSLRSMGKKLVFVTNNSTKSRNQYSKKFHSHRLDVSEVYVVGEEGILEELEHASFTYLGRWQEKYRAKISNFVFERDKSVGAVVVGLDQYINYYKLQYATLCIRENPVCLFIAINCDAVENLTDLQEWPGAGCMVAAVCGSTQQEPIVVGKPSTFMMDFYCKGSRLIRLKCAWLVIDWTLIYSSDILLQLIGACRDWFQKYENYKGRIFIWL